MRDNPGAIGDGVGSSSSDDGGQVTGKVDANSTSPDAAERARIQKEGIQGPESGIESGIDGSGGGVENGIEDDATNDLAQDAQDLEQQLIEETDGITSGEDVRVVQEDDKLVAQVTEQGKSLLQQRRAQELEQQFIQQHEAFNSRDDVQVTREDGKLVAEPTSRGKSALEGWQRIEASQAIEDQLEDELGRDVRPGEDFEVSTEEVEGHSPTSADLQRARNLRQAGDDQAANEALEAESGTRFTPDLSEEVERELSNKRAAAKGAVSPSGAELDKLTRSVETQQTSQKTPGRSDGDIFSGVVSGAEDASTKALELAAQPFGGDPEPVDVPGEGSVANVARQESTGLTADLGPVSTFGDASSDVGQTITQDYIAPASEAAGPFTALALDTVANFGRVDPRLAKRTLAEGGETSAGVLGEDEMAAEFEEEGEQIEEQSPLVGAKAGFGEGFVSGGASIANAPAIAGTVVDGTEFAVEGGARTVEGEGAEFVQEAGGQATLAAAEATEAAAANPARVTGQIAGGLVTSSGIIGGAKALGGAKAGRAASFAIQPGEELAITAARRGLVSGRAAQSVPGVRGAHLQGSKTSTGNSGLDVGIGGRSAFVGAREQLPNVRVEADPTAGRVEIDPELIEEVHQATLGRARRGVETVQQTPAKVRSGARKGRKRISDAKERALDVDFDDVVEPAKRGALRAGEGVRQAGGKLGTDIDDLMKATSRGAPGRGDVALQQAFARGSSVPSPAIPNIPDVSLDDIRAVPAAGAARAGKGVDEVMEFASRGAPGRTDVALQQSFTRGSAFPTGQGAGTLRRLPGQALNRAGEGVDDLIREVELGSPGSGDVALQQAFTRGSPVPTPGLPDLPDIRGAYRGGRERIEEAADATTESMDEIGRSAALRSPSVEGDVALQQAFTRGADVPFPNRPELDLPDVTGNLRREAAAARFGTAETVEGVKQDLSDLSDFTVRVGDSESTSLFEADEPGEIRSPFDDPMGLETDSETRRDGSRETETDFEDDGGVGGAETRSTGGASGVAIQRVISESEGRAETETRSSPGRNFGPEPGPLEEQGVGNTGAEDIPEPSLSEIGRTDAGQKPEVGVRGEVREGVDTRLGVESRQEPFQELRTEIGTEQRLDVRQEIGQEVRQEQSQEPRQERRIETGFDLDGGLPEGSDDGRRFSMFERTFEFGVAESSDLGDIDKAAADIGSLDDVGADIEGLTK